MLRQIGAVNEVGLIRHMLASTGARREEFLKLEKDLAFDVKLLATVSRKFAAKGNVKGLVRRAIDEALAQRGHPLPRHFAAEIKRELEPRLCRIIHTSQICKRRAIMFSKVASAQSTR